MRVLTVQQPWAWAIFHGKDVENRTTAWGYRGPLAIHAGTRLSQRGLSSPVVHEAAIRDRHDDEGARWLAASGDPRGLARGAILGVVDLVDVHTAHLNLACCRHEGRTSPWAEVTYHEHGGKVRRDIVHLVLRDARAFATPIPNVKGRLGLWTPDEDLTEAIEHALTTAACSTP